MATPDGFALQRARTREASRRTAQLPRRLAQVGLVARVALYCLLAALSLELAVGRPSAQTDAQGAFQELHRQPGGTAALIALACCLVAYALWRLHQAIFGTVNDPEAVWPRIGAGVIAVVYGLLLVNVVELLSSGATQSGSSKPQPFVATVLRWPAGEQLLAAAGIAIGIGGLVFIVWGATRDLGKILQRERMSTAWWWTARVTNAIGDAGRGAVACLLGGALVDAALQGRPSSAKGLGQLLASLRHLTAGPIIIGAFGVAFLTYACFSAIELVEGRL